MLSSSIEISEQSINNEEQALPIIPEISAELQTLLQRVADDVVTHLGCVGAMVATLEPENIMPVRAYSIDIPSGLLKQLESKLGTTVIGPRSISYLDDKNFKDNLSVRAVSGVNGRPQIVVSDKLYDLFRPVVNKPLSDLAQKLAGVKQVIAVPFFLEDEVVGNLFAAARSTFSQRDIDFLTAFGRQAAIAIQSQRNLTETQALERVILALQAKITDETQILQTIVDAVVHKLGYVGATVATLEGDNSLPIRSYAVNISPNLLKQLQSNFGPNISSTETIAYLNDEKFKENLSVRAIKGESGHPSKFVVSDSLYDLFRPIVHKSLSDLIQKMTGIKQVIAVPFFLDDVVIGNLFVATRKMRFSEREKQLLAAFGQQAAVGIRNARLYHRAEEQRRIAQLFGKMAFSAAANVHALRNQIGSFRSFLSLIKLLPMLPEAQRGEVLGSIPGIMEKLNESASILDSLHEPWRKEHDVPTDVNNCIILGIKKSFPKENLNLKVDEIQTEARITLHKSLSPDIPPINTSPDMLTEAFRILIKNSAEAIQEHGKGSDLWIECHMNGSMREITIRDNGIGIKPENLYKIFELGWSSKQGKGMGFGLFWTKDYVEGLGGTIDVESEWQIGTKFIIKLPV